MKQSNFKESRLKEFRDKFNCGLICDSSGSYDDQFKEVEQETRKEDIEIIENLKLKHSINPNSPSRERKIIYNNAIEDAKLSITNKEIKK